MRCAVPWEGMNDYSPDKTMNYPLMHKGKKYSFVIDRQGKGRCICKSDVLRHLGMDTEFQAVLFGGKWGRKRLNQLEDEFSFDVALPEWLKMLLWGLWLWGMWLTEDDYIEKTREIEAKVDRWLGEVIERENLP